MSKNGNVKRIEGLYLKALTEESISEADIYDALLALKDICPGDQGVGHPSGDTVVAIVNNGIMSIIKVDKIHNERMMRALHQLSVKLNLTTAEALLKLARLGAENTPRFLL